MNIRQVDWETLPWRPVREGVFRKAFSGEGATLALHRLMPGHAPAPHQHPHEQLVYIIAGTVDFHVGEETVRLSAGGLIAVPPNTMHYAVVVGNEPVINLDVFTPARPEYDR